MNDPIPAVSVIIPCHNSAAWIADTLDSVLAQTFQDFAIILVNDGSSDTEAFEAAIAPYRERVVYLKRENGGPSAARNTGIRHARSEYVAFLDSDDSWFPDYLDAQMRILRETPSLDLIFTDVLFYSDPAGPGIPYSKMYPSSGPVTFESVVMQTAAVATSQVVARKKAVVDAGLFDERFWRSEDFHLWVRMAHRGAHMAYQRRVLGRHRVRPEGLTGDSIKLLEGGMEVLRDLDAKLDLTPAEKAVILRKREEIQAWCNIRKAKEYLNAGRLREASEAFERANRFYHKTKYQLVLMGLKIAPHWTSFGLKTLDRWRSAFKPI